MRGHVLPGWLVAVVCAALTTGCSTEGRAPKGTVPPIDVAAPPADAEVTPSGLAYRFLARGGGGRRPDASSRVVVNYTGWTTDGEVIDGAPIGSDPVTVALEDAMPGWREAVRLMSEGDKIRVWIPVHLAYNGEPGKPRGMLVYDIYLVDFVR